MLFVLHFKHFGLSADVKPMLSNLVHAIPLHGMFALYVYTMLSMAKQPARVGVAVRACSCLGNLGHKATSRIGSIHGQTSANKMKPWPSFQL
jgi:hypothetical protein